jgi:hypothetical protein
VNGIHQTRRKPIAWLLKYFNTFLIKAPTSATDAFHAIRHRPIMIASRPKELRLIIGFVVSVNSGLEVSGIGGLKNCTRTYSPVVPVPSRSGLAVLRLVSFNAHARRGYRDGNIDVGGHLSGRSIKQVGWRFWHPLSCSKHPEPSGESSVSR